MLYQQYGHLLFDAIRETFENMAFAEVVPHSMLVGDKEFKEELKAMNPTFPANAMPDWGSGPAADAQMEIPWGTASSHSMEDVFSENDSEIDEKLPDAAWEKPLDAWGESISSVLPSEIENLENGNGHDVDFESLIKKQESWCWASMKVNSAELDFILFVVPQTLARELARTMYAGEEFEINPSATRDIIAELANVLGGRLMLLLEDLVGKFTLEVPQTGFGIPMLPEHSRCETVVCKVLVDGAYPVLTTMCFRDHEPETSKAKSQNADISTE